jgi:hypothetical protein
VPATLAGISIPQAAGIARNDTLMLDWGRHRGRGFPPEFPHFGRCHRAAMTIVRTAE